MIPRRRLLGGGVLGGLVGMIAGGDAAEAAPAAAADQQASAENVRRIATAIGGLREELQQRRQFTEIASIRDAQKTFLRSNGKFPDFIEVGADIWLNVYDWHVRWQQPMAFGRDPLGRQTILLHQTAVILRSDTLGSFMSLPYDNK